MNKTKTKSKAKNEYGFTMLQQLAFNAMLSGTAKNLTEACRQAGYKGGNNGLKRRAYELATNSNFMSVLEAKRAEISKKTEKTAVITKSECIQAFFDIAQKAKTEQGKLRAYENIARIYGLYELDNMQGKSFQPIQVNFNTADKSGTGKDLGQSQPQGEAPQELTGGDKAVYTTNTHGDTSDKPPVDVNDEGGGI